MKRFLLLLFLLSSSLWSLANHWVPDPHQFSNNMNMVGVIEINGVEQTTDAFELGAFYGSECRGSEMLAYYEGLDRYMVFMTLYGESGNELTFRIYDHSAQQELDVVPQVTVIFVPNGIIGGIHDPFIVAFRGGQCVITAHAIPEEGGTVTGGGAYWIGETCTLTATANEGFSFEEWRENGQQISTNPTMIVSATTNREFEAHFSVNTFEITATAMPDEGGTVTGMGSFTYGEEAILEAEPAEHYTFVNWTENGQMVSNEASYAFIVTSDRHLVANFAQAYYSILVTVDPGQGGTVQGAGNYVYGQTAHLTAIPNANYEFVEWTENGTVLSQEPEMSFVVTGSRNLVARFEYYDGVSEFLGNCSVYPNPTTGLVTVSGLEEGSEVKMIDGTGRFVLEKKDVFSNETIDVSGLPRGTYLLVIKGKKGCLVKRIMVIP